MSISKQYTIGKYRFNISSDATGYIIDMNIWEPIFKSAIKDFDISKVDQLKIRQVGPNLIKDHKCLNLYWIDGDNRGGFPNITTFKNFLITYSRINKLSKINTLKIR